LETIRHWAEIIELKVGVKNIWAFIDGTIRPICRPSSIEQRPWYTGYKKLHGFKFQAISTPDGLIISLFGPTTAADGDWMMWFMSDIEAILKELFSGILQDEEPMIYGDPAWRECYSID
jgi:hypothetical protein